MSSAEDKSLVQACLEGDSRSFEVLVERYYKVLFNVALRMLNDPEDARDVTQATFLRAFANLRTFDPRCKFFSWIYKILLSETANVLGRKKPMEQRDVNLVSPQMHPDNVYEVQRRHDTLGAALVRLSPEHREVVILRHCLALSYAEMADILGLPVKRVKSRLYEARRHLCNVLLDRSVKP